MKTLCIGESVWKITTLIDGYPQENNKYNLNEKISSGSGLAGNAAYLLGKWGVDTVIATSIGSDDFGTNIKKEFQDVNVNVNYIETSYDKETALEFTILNKQNASRTTFSVATEHPTLKKMDYDFTPDVILTDGLDYGASQNAISKFPNAISIIDAREATREVLELSKYTKYLIASQKFAETVTGLKFDFNVSQTIVNVYLKLQDKYPNSVILITLDQHGCLYNSGNQIKIMPGLKTNVVDKSGAGDIFRGAFIYGLINNFDIEKTVTIANIASGLSVSKLGVRSSMPTLSETLDYYAKKIGGQNSALQQPSM